MNASLSEAEQRDKLLAQAGSTARGENAWVNVILKPCSGSVISEGVETEVDELKVTDGWLIGMSGFNSFKIEKDEGCEDGDGEGILVGDTGALIDWRFARRGLAVECLEAVFEYGFYELGCGKMMLETNSVNLPFRGVMKGMGLGDVEREVKGKGDEEDSVVYLFDRSKWEDAKKGLKERGKWYLDQSTNSN